MKILIVHATAGAGHKKAAEAIYNSLKENPTLQLTFVDALDHVGWLYKRTYRSGYTFLVTKASWLWGFFFILTDVPALKVLVRWVRRCSNGINAKPLERLLLKEQYDVIFSTHFLSNEVAAYLKRKGSIKSKIISVVTDFDAHYFWLAKGIDCYTVACEYTRDKLIALGVSDGRILICGIPTDKKFLVQTNREALQKKLQIKNNIFTVLIATGSFGMGPIAEIVQLLKNCQVLVVCGNNQTLFARLKNKETEFIKIYGLVNNMDELMSVADIMVTKPGGLSISEALVKNLPLIFFSAIPGQETNNVMVLKTYGIGTEGKDVASIVAEVDKLRESQEYLNQAKQNIRRLAKPSAVNEIIKIIV